MRYRYAYVDQVVDLCDRHAKTYRYPLGPVVDARDIMPCDDCYAEQRAQELAATPDGDRK